MPVDVTQQLKDAGLRVTVPRRTVLEVLGEHPHATAHSVADRTRERIGRVSTQAIYGVLAACTDVGLVRAQITDLDCVVGTPNPASRPLTTPGFVLEEAEVVFWGLCPQCQLSSHNDL